MRKIPSIALRSLAAFGKTAGRFYMKKETNKSNEAQLLDLLKKVLPKATHDANLAGKIYEAVELELKTKSRANAFDKFCARVELPDLEPTTIEKVQEQLTASFGEADIALKPNRKEKSLAVELTLPDGNQFSGVVKVDPNAGKSEEEELPAAKFVPFPVCLPGDKELVWMMARRDNLSPQEAAVALTKAEEDFWGSKTGQKLQRDRVEKSFPEFVSRAPAGLLNESGLKRHYKTPEAVKTLRAKSNGA